VFTHSQVLFGCIYLPSYVVLSLIYTQYGPNCSENIKLCHVLRVLLIEEFTPRAIQSFEVAVRRLHSLEFF
jgi:hypothetical protein